MSYSLSTNNTKHVWDSKVYWSPSINWSYSLVSLLTFIKRLTVKFVCLNALPGIIATTYCFEKSIVVGKYSDANLVALPKTKFKGTKIK